MSLEEYFATGPAHERPVFEAVMACLAGAGPVHVEPVSVGIFLRNPHKVAELRPRDRWVAVSFTLPHQAHHRTIVRKVIRYGAGWFHVANVAEPAAVDDELAGLLVQAYDLARSREQ
jgi:hypothetical protein